MTSAVEAENPEMTQFECWASVKEFLISHRSIFLPILMFFGFMGLTCMVWGLIYLGVYLKNWSDWRERRRRNEVRKKSGVLLS